MARTCPKKLLVIDWDCIPPPYKWASFDAPEGVWYIFERKPETINSEGIWTWRNAGEWTALRAFQKYLRTPCTIAQARASLRCRPSV